MRGALKTSFVSEGPAIDITLRVCCPALGNLAPMRLMWMVLCCRGARADKEATYPELLTGRCRLVVMAIETGGRWSSEAMDFVRQLEFAKARRGSSHMQFPIALVWERRWTRMLSTACFPRFCLLPCGTF